MSTVAMERLKQWHEGAEGMDPNYTAGNYDFAADVAVLLHEAKKLEAENARLREAAIAYLRTDASNHDATHAAEGRLREALGLV
jgi:hypothetical protein